jgi:hypothetical protein
LRLRDIWLRKLTKKSGSTSGSIFLRASVGV